MKDVAESVVVTAWVSSGVLNIVPIDIKMGWPAIVLWGTLVALACVVNVKAKIIE